MFSKNFPLLRHNKHHSAIHYLMKKMQRVLQRIMQREIFLRSFLLLAKFQSILLCKYEGKVFTEMLLLYLLLIILKNDDNYFEQHINLHIFEYQELTTRAKATKSTKVMKKVVK